MATTASSDTPSKSIKEGLATICLPPNVFYNPVQEFNRDLTIAVITQFMKDRDKFTEADKSNNKHKGPNFGKKGKFKNDEKQKMEVDQNDKDTTNCNASPVKEDSTTPLGTNNEVPNMNLGNEVSVKIEDTTNLETTSSTSAEYMSLDVEKTANFEDTAENSKTVNAKNPKSASTDSGEISESKPFRILEALAASGLRSVRFALEIPNVSEIVANDYSTAAVEFIKKNAEANSVDKIITPSCNDASMVMYSSRKLSSRFDVIDLDPYGSPTPFLDAALQSVAENGLLCVTCTDMAVLCGNATETCHSKYGSTSLHSKFCHEMALRILLRCIESHANRYSRYITPLLSISVDFYCRVFVRVNTSQLKVKDSACKLSNVYQCNGCSTFYLQPVVAKTKHGYRVGTGPPVGPSCSFCGHTFNIGGPIWSHHIHDAAFVHRVLESVKGVSRLNTSLRIVGMLSVISEELWNNPLYYNTDELCRIVHCVHMGFLPIRSAILNAGYLVSLSHASKTSIKTSAPPEVIWDIIRCWVKIHPVAESRLKEGSVAKAILSVEPKLEANFSVHPKANPLSRRSGLVRWQINPEPDWGPKPKAARAQNDGSSENDQPNKKRKLDPEELKKKFRTKPCRKFAMGKCPYGENCHYSHEVTSGEVKVNENQNTSENLTANSETVSKNAKINSEDNKINSQDNKIDSEDNKIDCQDNKMDVQDTKTDSQDNKIDSKDNSVSIIQ